MQVPVNTWQAYNPWGGKSLYPFNSSDLAPAVRVSLDRPLAFTAQGPFDWEYNLVRFLEREGYDLSYQTNIETDLRPESLLEHRLVIVAGHDEYWTKRTRDAFGTLARSAPTSRSPTRTPPTGRSGTRTADARSWATRRPRPIRAECGTQDRAFATSIPRARSAVSRA